MEQTRKLPGLTRAAEEEHLRDIIEVAEANLQKNRSGVKELNDDLHDLLESYGAKDVEALSMWRNTVTMLEETRQDLTRSEKARKKPYFGRIDFYDEDLKRDEAFYIGRVGIARGITKLEVIDWRAPVANAYYENSLGKCTYQVKNENTFHIDLKVKRTYEIEQDKLKDYYDSDVVANDELLTKYLAKNKKAVLGEIIATIQKEQNDIIRKPPRQNIIVQGVAGSGKTTVAMHRISYILYNYQEEYRPEDFYIVGSNRILLNYITSVLPDLDVYGIRQMTMEQLFVRLLYEDWDDKKYKIGEVRRGSDAESVKGTLEWYQDLEEYCRKLEWDVIPRESVYLEMEGREKLLFLTRESTESYIQENPMVSIQNKIAMLNDRVMAKVENEITGKQIKYKADEKKEIKRNYRYYFGYKEWKKSIFEIYEEFLASQAEAGKKVEVPTDTFDVYDLAALAYLYKRVKETELIREAHHIVIDEAQDFGMMAYAVLKYCIRGCSFTIMGDVSQNIHFGYGLNDWEQLKQQFLTNTYDSFNLLKKSYRNTVEISNFATEVLRHGTFAIYPVEPIIRHGNPVLVEQQKDRKALLQRTSEIVKSWQEQGFETIAVVCRDNEEASKTVEELSSYVELADSDLEKAEFGNGVMVLPVSYTKGLEFDAVLLFDPTREDYPVEDGHAKLLYVAATRALHELAVLHTGDLTGLIADPVPEGRKNVSLEREEDRPVARKVVRRDVLRREPVKHEVEKYGPQKIVVPGQKSGHNSAQGGASKSEQNGIQRGASQGDQNGLEKGSRNGSRPATTVVHTVARLQNSTGAQNLGNTRTAGRSQTGRIPYSAVGAKAGTVSSGVGVRKAGAVSSGTGARKAGAMSSVAGARKAGAVSSGTGARKAGLIAGSSADPAQAVINPSPYKFGELPDTQMLRPAGHARIDLSIRWVEKTKDGLNLVSNYGTLRLSPVAENVIRVTFARGHRILDEYSDCVKARDVERRWMYKDVRDAIELTTDQLLLRVEKKTGAIQFMTRDKKPILAERSTECRQLESGQKNQAWVFFDWAKSEKINALGAGSKSRLSMDKTARYISFGQSTLKLPCVLSNKGYGLAMAGDSTVMCCNIPLYGAYFYLEDVGQIDYYFFTGSGEEALVKTYDHLAGRD